MCGTTAPQAYRAMPSVDVFHRHHIWGGMLVISFLLKLSSFLLVPLIASLQVGGTQVCTSSGNPSHGPEVHSVFSSGDLSSSWVYQGQQRCAVCFGIVLDDLDQQLKRGIFLSDISMCLVDGLEFSFGQSTMSPSKVH